MSQALAEQQQALVHALWARRPGDALVAAGQHLVPGPLLERGLRAYRSNGRSLAERALAAAYPAVALLLGEENQRAVAHQLWLAHPPADGDLACWGAMLADWIAHQAELIHQEPYLPDVARLEWAMHRAGSAADGAPDLNSFALLTTQAPETLALRIAPGTFTLASAWPAVSIIQAQLEGQPTLEQAGERVRAGVAEAALVWRQALRPRLRHAQAGEAAFIVALQQGQSLADALLSAPELQFDQWLAPAVHSGLLLGAVLYSA